MAVLPACLPEEIYIGQDKAFSCYDLVAVLVLERLFIPALAFRQYFRLIVFIGKVIVESVEFLPERYYCGIVVVSVLLQHVQLRCGIAELAEAGNDFKLLTVFSLYGLDFTGRRSDSGFAVLNVDTVCGMLCS